MPLEASGRRSWWVLLLVGVLATNAAAVGVAAGHGGAGVEAGSLDSPAAPATELQSGADGDDGNASVEYERGGSEGIEQFPDRPQGVPDGATVAAASSTATAEVTQEYDLTPETPGSVRLHIEYDIPDSFETFEETVYTGEQTVLTKQGFTLENSNTLRWDGETTDPYVELRLTINETVKSSYNAVDVGEWAFFSPHPTDYDRANVSVTAASSSRSITYGDTMAFLGEQTTYERDGEKHEFGMAVPEAADTAVDPERVLEELDDASQLLDFGPGTTYDRIDVWVAPEPIRSGGAAVDDEFWVSADTDFRAESTYIHEYVHTRQDRIDLVYGDDAQATEWLTEATASFYGVFTNWQLGNDVSFRVLGAAARTTEPGTVLANRSTYDGESPGYGQGQAVVAALDYRIREATDGDASFEEVMRRMGQHDGKVNVSDLERIVEDVADREFDEFFDAYVSGREIAPAPRDPSAYGFVETATIEQGIDGPAGTTDGQVFVQIDTLSLNSPTSSLPAIPGIRTVQSTYAVVDPGESGDLSMPVERATETPFEDYGLTYVQSTPGGETFPRDGVADLAVLNDVDSVPFDGGRADLGDAAPTTVTVVDGNGTPVPNATVEVSVGDGDERALVSLPTTERGHFLNRNGTRGIELRGRHRVSIAPILDDFPLQGATGEIPDSGAVDVQAVLKEEVPDLYVSMTAVPHEVTTGESEIHLVATPSSPSEGITRTVYVDGEPVETVEIQPQNEYRSWTVPAGVDFEEPGTHTVRVGDAPAQTVTVTESEDDGVAQFDENDDGSIDTGELRAAVDQWVTGEIGTDLLQKVVDAWVTGSF
jgi:hypothetical protein